MHLVHGLEQSSTTRCEVPWRRSERAAMAKASAGISLLACQGKQCSSNLLIIVFGDGQDALEVTPSSRESSVHASRARCRTTNPISFCVLLCGTSTATSRSARASQWMDDPARGHVHQHVEEVHDHVQRNDCASLDQRKSTT